ncbi:uncharacterized protein [Nicotiana tomentosiformis]|uniref:uncharacterized protein n=1 Tax=Nicotiana tomentosiformis TaxID=4098 RepID=UPI00388CE764
MSSDLTDVTQTSIGTGSSILVDLTHPYFLHAFDTPGMVLVNTPFDGRGHNSLRSENLDKCNDMVTSWLLNPLTKRIADSVLYSKIAKDLWTYLEHIFGQSNGAKLYHLQKKLADLVQGSTDIAGYFTKLKCLWDELDTPSTNM